MKCKLSECEWCSFGSCCPESEEMYNEVILNSKGCPHYYDLKTAADNERKEMADGIINILKELNNPLAEIHQKEILALRGMDLWEAYHNTFNLYELHMRNQFLDNILNELDTYGIDWVRKKYELNK